MTITPVIIIIYDYYMRNTPISMNSIYTQCAEESSQFFPYSSTLVEFLVTVLEVFIFLVSHLVSPYIYIYIYIYIYMSINQIQSTCQRRFGIGE